MYQSPRAWIKLQDCGLTNQEIHQRLNEKQVFHLTFFVNDTEEQKRRDLPAQPASLQSSSSTHVVNYVKIKNWDNYIYIFLAADQI